MDRKYLQSPELPEFHPRDPEKFHCSQRLGAASFHLFAGRLHIRSRLKQEWNRKRNGRLADFVSSRIIGRRQHRSGNRSAARCSRCNEVTGAQSRCPETKGLLGAGFLPLLYKGIGERISLLLAALCGLEPRELWEYWLSASSSRQCLVRASRMNPAGWNIGYLFRHLGNNARHGTRNSFPLLSFRERYLRGRRVLLRSSPDRSSRTELFSRNNDAQYNSSRFIATCLRSARLRRTIYGKASAISEMQSPFGSAV